MVDKKEVMALLKANFKTTGQVTIDPEGLITCQGNVILKRQLLQFPVRFKSVLGHFHCDTNQLLTLDGAPESVGGSFLCGNNDLISLNGAPKSVGGSFVCILNQLTSLEGAPSSVGDLFSCHLNPLTSLQGMPLELFYLAITYTPTLPLLRCLAAKSILFRPTMNHTTVEIILNRYAGQGRRAMFDCQKDLIDAGFEDNARW
jgi:hypothetical protein